jgi:hypothetical protein
VQTRRNVAIIDIPVLPKQSTPHMADDYEEYKVGPGRPPLHTRFRKRQSGNPGGRSQQKLPALLAAALNEPGPHGRRRTSQDPQARGGDQAARQQIRIRRSASCST